ncbi:MAG: sigma-70 family RNA polymerase sigma factor [Ferruginibacter sp.]|nr:sigma-70 family RNA polymerase sigma factor [Ferruginibacter sp.]
MIQKDKDGFLLQLQQHRLIIYKICNAYCKNTSDRDDLAQEITYQLWRSFHHFNGSVKFSTWMYRVALNVAITFYRKTKTSEAIIQLGEPDTEIEDRKEDSAELEKNKNLLQQFINELKELDKALMILYLEEKTYSEISEILGVTETNVATRISRIKDKLKQRFLTVNN